MSDQIHTENLLKRILPTQEGEPGVIKRHLPTALTWIRIGLAVAFPFLPHTWRLAALVVAAITEWFDGALARLWNVESEFGRRLDPVADKLFVASMLGTFVWEGWLNIPELLIVAARDICVMSVAGWVYLFGDRDELGRMGPRVPGKLATTAQFIFLLVVLFWHTSPWWLVAVVGGFSVVAAADYARFYFTEVRGEQAETTQDEPETQQKAAQSA